MTRIQYFYIPVLAVLCIGVFLFFNFTAEDAYITCRYAENLVDGGALVFNNNERINALTSPLHALLSSLLFLVTGHTVLANKLIALVLFFVSAVLIWQRFKRYPELQLLALSMVLLPSCVLLWTVGGLETPFLFFVVTITVIIVGCGSVSTFGLKLLCLVFLLAGIGFLLRYDAAFFFAPVVVFAALKARSRKHIPIAVAAGASRRYCGSRSVQATTGTCCGRLRLQATTCVSTWPGAPLCSGDFFWFYSFVSLPDHTYLQALCEWSVAERRVSTTQRSGIRDVYEYA